MSAGRTTSGSTRCFCTAALLIDDGLVVCADEGHIIALATALPADALEALSVEGAVR